GLEGVVSTRRVSSDVVELTVSTATTTSKTDALTATIHAIGAELVPVFVEPGIERDASTLFIDDGVLVRFTPDFERSAIEALGAQLGFEVQSELRYAPNGFRLRVLGNDLGHNALSVANTLYESGAAEWSHPDFLAHRSLRFEPNDPHFAEQWHLENTGQGGGVAGA